MCRLRERGLSLVTCSESCVCGCVVEKMKWSLRGSVRRAFAMARAECT